ncbi:PapD-like protein [Rickenella mellea]|uniref:PapD-like protein n=1 Tax=Rickenella mellea TaxID=50990 RepID=A0A4Y7PU48_9AGAM|nr:PapD-like protein [Rickenella mellea]
MSVDLTPSRVGFNRPFTQNVKRILTVTNYNELPVAFKVKVTAPNLYCVTPNCERLAPGERAKLRVTLLANKKELPLNEESIDKFVVQSTVITSEKESLSPRDCKFWTSLKGRESEVFQQTIDVDYLPPLGQTEEAEEEGVYEQTLDIDAWRFGVWNSAQQPNGHAAESVFRAANFMPIPYPVAQQPAQRQLQQPTEVELAQAQKRLRTLFISVPGCVAADPDGDSTTKCDGRTKVGRLAYAVVIRRRCRRS